jgi:NADH-quinone oxidoreductase subunit M
MTGLVPACFAGLLLLPWLNAALAGRAETAQRARILGAWGAFLTLIVAGLLASAFYTGHAPSLLAALPLSGSYGLHFAIDNLNAPLLILLSALTLTVVLGAPAALLTPPRLRALLRLEALTLLTLSSADLLLLALGYCLVLLPTRRPGTSAEKLPQRIAMQRVFMLYQWFGLACFLSAIALLAYALRPDVLLAGSLNLDMSTLPPTLEAVVFGLLFSAAFVRMGVVPLHSWLPASLEHGSLLSVAFLVSMRTGLYLLARFVIPAFPELTEDAMPLLTTLALCSAMYGAVAALGQYDLRRMVGFLIVSQSGIMLIGLVLGDAHAAAGTLLYWLGFTVATMGLTLMIASLRARTGTSDMRELGGVVRRVPHLSAYFFLFGLATIAVPGTLAFPAEDMLIHGALEAHPMLTIVMVIAMVLNAVTVVKAFAHTFLGQPTHKSMVLGALQDLLPRERAASVALLVALIAGGLYPQLLLEAQAAAAEHIAQIRDAAHASR